MNNININCPINGTGYGSVSLNIVKALDALGLDVSLFLMGQATVNTEQDAELMRKLLEKAKTFQYKAPFLKIWHQWDLAYHIGRGTYYAFPFFEIDTLNPTEKHHLNYTDTVFVASEWAKQILIQNDIKVPVVVAPLGVNTTVFNYIPKIKIQNNYVFFHIGKWEHRKAQDFLLKAFEAAFTDTDSVELWLLPDNPFLSEQEVKYWENLVNTNRLSSKIRICPRLNTQYDVAQVMANADCGVFVSRAEGWNNEILESMAMNKPVIVTNYSGHTEFCTKDNSFLVDIDELEPANDGKWFHGTGKWAKLSQPQFTQTVEYMRWAYENTVYSNKAGLATAQKYSWNRTASIINKTIGY